jgi:putative transposase
LSQCIEWRGKPKRIRSDNGTEFIAGKTKVFFSNTNIDHIPIQKGKPSQNGYIERFNRSYREGVLDAFVLTSIHEARMKRCCGWMITITIIPMKALAIKHQQNADENGL